MSTSTWFDREKPHLCGVYRSAMWSIVFSHWKD